MRHDGTWLHFGAFDDAHDALEASRECVGRGMDVVDVFGPHPVHGIEDVLGLRPSRLSWVCFIAGLTGLAFALWLQYWTSADDWPLNVGGKPFESLPAFIPVAFEMTVLFAGLGTVAAFLAWARLYPGRRPPLELDRATDDRFVVVVRGAGAPFSVGELARIFEGHAVARMWDRMMEERR